MAIHGPLVAATVWFGQVDLSGNCNKIDGPHCTVVDLDTTNFASGGAHARTGGLYDSDTNIEGFAEYGANLQDDYSFAAVDSISPPTRIVSISPTGADGAVAYTFQGLHLDYKTGTQVGSVQPYALNVKGRGTYPTIRGNILLPKQAMAATTNGTVTNLGAVSATQSVYASLHVFAASGTNPTLDVTVQSAALVGFGTPTTRITFAQQTAAGSVFATPTAGAITDAFWRVTATIGGTGGPNFTAAVVVGIQ